MAPRIDDIVNSLLLTKGSFSSADLVAATGLSRQALHRHLVRRVEAGDLLVVGGGRSTHYTAAQVTFRRHIARHENVGEDQVWSEARRALPQLARHELANALYGYAFTEMLNNALDHSSSPTIEVHGSVDGPRGRARFSVVDQGIGAFENVRAHLYLRDHMEAIEALSKGKVSTQPERHSGEGIFFTSKMGNTFSLEANGLLWLVDNVRDDETISASQTTSGTAVHFEVALETTLTPTSVFERYAHDFEFDTTRVVVKLFERGGEFVSRSEAKRVVSGLERFHEVIFDFHRIASVGQGFADEVFRVWARAHPETKLVPERMEKPVEFMIERARRTADRPDR